jgi:hypothetical protein
MMHKTKACLVGCVSAAFLVLVGACAARPGGAVATAPGEDPYKMTVEEVARAPLERDIVEVHTHYNLFPWLQFDPVDPRPQGFMVSALFLVSGKTGKGVFADGTIAVKMYRVDAGEQGRETRTLLQTWEYTPQQALLYRAVKRTVVGEGYQLRVCWRKDLDLVDRQIVTVVEFTRLDGKVIRSGAKFFKVPSKVNG